MTVLVVAAEAREFAGLCQLVGSGKALSWPVAFARAIQRPEGVWVLVANGPGPKLAREAATVAGQRMKVDRVISAGFCGALDPAFRVGEVFAAGVVEDAQEGSVYPAELPRGTRKYASGRLISMDRVIVQQRERQDLWRKGWAAVEMEAAGVAAWTAERSLPFACWRVVSDSGQESFSIDFNQMRRSDGRFAISRITAQALLHPIRVAPELIRLQRQASVAARAWGEFFAQCEF